METQLEIRTVPARPRRHPRLAPGDYGHSKVPEITAFFWIVKALTTAMGESTSDFLVHSMIPEVAVLLGFAAFLVALYWQFSTDRYVARVYWFAVAMVGVFGTMAADVLHVGLGVPYIASTIFYAAVLAVVFEPGTEPRERSRSTASTRGGGSSSTGRRSSRRSRSAPPRATSPRTRLGSATSLRPCFSPRIIAIPAIGHWRFGMGPILAFWFAYVVTRPLGASFADWLSLPADRGGLGLGTGPVSLVFAAVIACFVAYLGATRLDVPAEPDPA